MNEKESLFYALGHLAYAVAMADGSVQNEERQIVHDIVTREIKDSVNPEINISEIIFSILQKQEEDVNITFNRGIKELENCKKFMNEDMRAKFVDILYKVAEAFPPIEQGEAAVIDKFKNYLENN